MWSCLFCLTIDHMVDSFFSIICNIINLLFACDSICQDIWPTSKVGCLSKAQLYRARSLKLRTYTLCGYQDLNLGPRHYQCRALTNWAITADLEARRFELLTFWMQIRRSTNWAKPPSSAIDSGKREEKKNHELVQPKTCRFASTVCVFKGGDPAPPSDRATLLRLHPSHRQYLRRLPLLRVSTATSGTTNSHDVTGGVYKARERIHGVVADTPLLAIPTSCEAAFFA